MKIRAEHVQAIEDHARRGYPDEVCGVLVGRTAAEVTVESVIPVANREREAPRVRYQIAPEDLLRIQRESREERLDIVGFYHSHPDHPARPSETDRRIAAEGLSDGVVHVVVSVDGAGRATPVGVGVPGCHAGVRRGAAGGRRSPAGTGGGRMPIKVLIPGPLRPLTAGAGEVEVDAVSVGGPHPGVGVPPSGARRAAARSVRPAPRLRPRLRQRQGRARAAGSGHASRGRGHGRDRPRHRRRRVKVARHLFRPGSRGRARTPWPGPASTPRACRTGWRCGCGPSSR